MADYATTLHRSLIDRAGTLGEYIRALQGHAGRSDDGFALALEMCHSYTQLIQRQVNAVASTTRDATAYEQRMRGWAKEFFEKESWIDQRFTRGNQGEVPRALKTMARHEFKRHGLQDQEPVLTVGPPDNFESHKSDLWDYLFGNLWTLRDRSVDQPDLPVNRRLSIISVPYIEGTRTLWYPITLGHEIGHLRLEAEGQQALLALTHDWFDETDAEYVAVLKDAEERAKRPNDDDEQGVEVYADNPGADDEEADEFDVLGTVRLIRTTLVSWVGEMLCDLNAVRLFGPAGLNAIAEFLAVLGTSDEASIGWQSHPPLTLRLKVMVEFLKLTGQGTQSSQMTVWDDYVKSREGKLELPLEEGFVAGCFNNPINLERLAAHALTWGQPYRASSRERAIDWLTNELLDGVPGGTHSLHRDGDVITVADAANAAWEARSALEEPGDRAGRGLVLLDAPEDRIPRPTKRLLVDRLASKAIDSIEFTRLWRSTSGTVEDIRALDVPASDPPSWSGVLSRNAIVRRMKEHEAVGKRLVVTPLLTGSIQDAGVDIRLGPDFIVFRHSSTGAFDALDRAQDPHILQEAVAKDWGAPFILHPGELVLAATLEYVVVPDDTSAQVVTRSSYGRLGLITATAVQVQPGSRGCITLELVNHGDTPIALTPGARIGQLIFYALQEPGPITPGKYRFPVGPEFSKVGEDRDAGLLDLIKRAARSDLDRAERYGSASRELPVTFSTVLPEPDGAYFEEIAEREGIETIVGRVPHDTTRRQVSDILTDLDRGEPIAYLSVAGLGRITAFATALIRYSLAYARGIDLEVGRDGEVAVRPAPENAGGEISIVAYRFDGDVCRRDIEPERTTVTVSSVESADERRELGRLLRGAILKRQPKIPPDDDPPDE